MRIERIAIDGFGAWHDRRIEPSPGLTVLRGPNEAGKTTILAFVRAMLFGFETNRYPALAGGRRGGWLDLVTADGRPFRVERYGDRGGEGNLRVIAPDGRDVGAGGLRRLVHDVDASVYCNVFAFSLAELAEFKALTERDVASRIYGAGQGTGAASARALEDAFRAEAAAIFKPGGQNPAINRRLREIEELDRQLTAIDMPASYAAVSTRLAEREAERARLDERIAALAAERRLVERICSGWDAWVSLRSAGEALRSLPDAPRLPQDLLERLSRLEEASRTSRLALDDVDRRRRRLEDELAALHVDERLLTRAAEVEALVAERAEERARADSLAAAREELSASSRLVDDALADLGEGWDVERVLALDTSVAVRAELNNRLRNRLDDASRTVREREARAFVARGARDQLAGDLSLVEERLAELAREQQDVADSPGRPGAGAHAEAARPIGGLLAATLLAAAAIAAAVAAAGAWPAAVVLAALAVAGTAVAWGVSRAREPELGPRTLLEARRAALEEQRDACTARMRAADADVAEAETALAAADEGRRAATAEWRDWLESHRLDSGVDREGALAILETAQRARERIRHRDDVERVVRRLEEASAGHRRRAATLLGTLGRPAAVDPSQALDVLAAELRSAREAASETEQLGRRLAEARADEEAARARCASDHGQLADLLRQYGARDAERLRELATVAATRRRHQESADSARRALAAISGPGDALERLSADLAAVTEIAEERARLDAFSGELERQSATRDALLEEIGGLNGELRRLEASVQASDLRQRRATLVAMTAADAERWAVVSLAAALLERTRQRYEREHRPEVVRAAERYIAEWTAGRYVRIVAPLGGTTDGLEREDGRQVPLAGLSQGTTEQLYLALRFGLIEHFAAEAEPLPIVMDEILVNFDPERAERAARSIERLASTHQILYFTCRSDVAFPDAPVFELPAPASAAVQPAAVTV